MVILASHTLIQWEKRVNQSYKGILMLNFVLIGLQIKLFCSLFVQFHTNSLNQDPFYPNEIIPIFYFGFKLNMHFFSIFSIFTRNLKLTMTNHCGKTQNFYKTLVNKWCQRSWTSILSPLSAFFIFVNLWGENGLNPDMRSIHNPLIVSENQYFVLGLFWRRV